MPEATPRTEGISAYAKKYLLARLPGHGEKSPGCGELRWLVCNECYEGSTGFMARRSCVTRECPDCYEKWASKEARIASWRVWAGARYVARQLATRYFRIVHCVVSFEADDSELSSFRTRAYDVLRKHGINGGIMVWHPFRKNEKGTFEFDGYVHFHVIGIAYGNIETPEAGQGYVFKVIRDAEHKDYKGFRSPGAVKRALGYLLSHCGILDGVHAVTWFGVTSYNKLAIAKLKMVFRAGYDEMMKPKGTKCPYCNSEDTELMDTWKFDERSMRWYFCERSRFLLSVRVRPGGDRRTMRADCLPRSLEGYEAV